MACPGCAPLPPVLSRGGGIVRRTHACGRSTQARGNSRHHLLTIANITGTRPSMALTTISVRGAREPNLKGIDLDLPRDSLIVALGRAHVCTPVTNAHLVSRLLLAKKKHQHKHPQLT